MSKTPLSRSARLASLLAFLMTAAVGLAAPPTLQTSPPAPMPAQTAAPPPSVPATSMASASSGEMPMPPPAAMVLQQMHMVNQFEIKAANLASKKATGTRVLRFADRLRRDHAMADRMVKKLDGRLGYHLRDPAQMRQMMMQQQGAMKSSAGGKMPAMPMQKSPPPTSAPPKASMPSKPMPGEPMPSPKPMMQKMQMSMLMMQDAMSKLQAASSGQQFDQAYLMVMIKGHEKAIQMLEQVEAKGVDQPQVTGLVHKLLPILKQHLQLAQLLQSRMTRQ